MPKPISNKLAKLFSPWDMHKIKWRDCQRCDLCKGRNHVVLLKGVIPASVLMLGEAPGQSEDVIGQPFVGPAGRLLHKIIERAVAANEGEPTFAYSNLIACLPMQQGEKAAQPPKASIEACAPRVVELVALTKPKLIVCVGELAYKWLPKILQEPKYASHHPSPESQTARTGLSKEASPKSKAVQRGNPVAKVSQLYPKIITILHPAAILRSEQIQQSLAIKRCIITLAEAFGEL